MSLIDIPSINRIWSELTKIKFTDNDINSHIPGGIFFIHSVKSPLSSLEINLGELERVTADCQNKEVKELLGSVRLASKQIRQLVSDIPNLDKISHSIKINVFEIFQGLKTLYQKEDRSYKLVFNIKLRSGKESIKINKLHFFELMTCLIRNGFEAYENRDKNKVVIVTVVERKKQLEIQVQDFGSGVNYLQVMMMTKNGYSTKNSGQGFGMWFVKRIVEKHFKRKLKIISEVGSGTIVKFSLPVA